MEDKKWRYTQTRAIKNYDDLDRELERANLHQKFLGAMLNNDKELMKRALSLPNLIQRGLVSFIGKSENEDGEGGENNSNLTRNNIISLVAKWILSRFF